MFIVNGSMDYRAKIWIGNAYGWWHDPSYGGSDITFGYYGNQKQL